MELTPENFIQNTVEELQIKMRETEEEFVYELYDLILRRLSRND